MGVQPCGAQHQRLQAIPCARQPPLGHACCLCQEYIMQWPAGLPKPVPLQRVWGGSHHELCMRRRLCMRCAGAGLGTFA